MVTVMVSPAVFVRVAPLGMPLMAMDSVSLLSVRADETSSAMAVSSLPEAEAPTLRP